MKKVIAGTLLICVLTVLSGCSAWNNHFDGIKIIEQVKDWTETLGKKQITKDSDLCGERILEQEGDYYSGSYNAQAEQMAGRKVIFGGAGVENRTVICSGNIETKSGSAAIRVRMNEEVIYLSPDDNGYFEKELSFESGGNYIMVDYEDFTGSIELRCTEREDRDEEKDSFLACHDRTLHCTDSDRMYFIDIEYLVEHSESGYQKNKRIV